MLKPTLFQYQAHAAESSLSKQAVTICVEAHLQDSPQTMAPYHGRCNENVTLTLPSELMKDT